AVVEATHRVVERLAALHHLPAYGQSEVLQQRDEMQQNLGDTAAGPCRIDVKQALALELLREPIEQIDAAGRGDVLVVLQRRHSSLMRRWPTRGAIHRAPRGCGSGCLQARGPPVGSPPRAARGPADSG